MELTRNETKLMNIFWNAKRPLSREELIKLNPDAAWEMGALHSTINRLLAKGAIKEAGIYKRGRRMGRLFAAEYTLQDHLTDLLSPADDHIDYCLLLRALLHKTESAGEDLKILYSLKCIRTNE